MVLAWEPSRVSAALDPAEMKHKLKSKALSLFEIAGLIKHSRSINLGFDLLTARMADRFLCSTFSGNECFFSFLSFYYFLFFSVCVCVCVCFFFLFLSFVGFCCCCSFFFLFFLFF